MYKKLVCILAIGCMCLTGCSSKETAKIEPEIVEEKEEDNTQTTEINEKQVIEYLKKQGFKRVGQEGSHIKFVKGGRTVIVPNHGSKDIAKGTLRIFANVCAKRVFPEPVEPIITILLF